MEEKKLVSGFRCQVPGISDKSSGKKRRIFGGEMRFYQDTLILKNKLLEILLVSRMTFSPKSDT